MIVPVDISTKRSKSVATKKKKYVEKVSSSQKEPCEHIAKKIDSNTIEKIIDHAETTIEEPNVKPHVELHADSHVESNVETYVPTSGEPHVKPPTELAMDILVFDTRLEDTSFEDWSNVEIHHVKVEVQIKNGKDKQNTYTPVVDLYLNDILNGNHESDEELRIEDPQNEYSKGQGERNE